MAIRTREIAAGLTLHLPLCTVPKQAINVNTNRKRKRVRDKLKKGNRRGAEDRERTEGEQEKQRRQGMNINESMFYVCMYVLCERVCV